MLWPPASVALLVVGVVLLVAATAAEARGVALLRHLDDARQEGDGRHVHDMADRAYRMRGAAQGAMVPAGVVLVAVSAGDGIAHALMG